MIGFVRERAHDLDQGTPLHVGELKTALGLFGVVEEITSAESRVDKCALLMAIRSVSRECGNIRNFFLVNFGMFLEALEPYASDNSPLGQAYRAVISGSEIGAIAITGEKESGAESTSVLISDSGGFRLSGTKSWVTLGSFATFILVSCFFNGARVMVLIDAAGEGVEILPKHGLLGNRGSGIAKVILRDVWVDSDSVLSTRDAAIMSGEGEMMSFARLAAAESGLGMGAAAISHVSTRLLAGGSKSDYKRDLGALEARRRVLEGHLGLVRLGLDRAKAVSSAEAIALKVVASAFARDAADLLARVSGSRAYDESDISNRIWRESQSFRYIEGSDSVLENHLGNIALVEDSFV